MPKTKSVSKIKKSFQPNFLIGLLIGIFITTAVIFVYIKFTTRTIVEIPTNGTRDAACLAACHDKLNECKEVYPEGHPGRLGCVQMHTSCAERCPSVREPGVYPGTK